MRPARRRPRPRASEILRRRDLQVPGEARHHAPPARPAARPAPRRPCRGSRRAAPCRAPPAAARARNACGVWVEPEARRGRASPRPPPRRTRLTVSRPASAAGRRAVRPRAAASTRVDERRRDERPDRVVHEDPLGVVRARAGSAAPDRLLALGAARHHLEHARHAQPASEPPRRRHVRGGHRHHDARDAGVPRAAPAGSRRGSARRRAGGTASASARPEPHAGPPAADQHGHACASRSPRPRSPRPPGRAKIMRPGRGLEHVVTVDVHRLADVAACRARPPPWCRRRDRPRPGPPPCPP